MGKLKWRIILVIALWLVFCGMASAVELHVGSGQTYSTIRGAVDAAGDGDVIIVHAGSYTEHVRVAKRLTLLGEGADVVTVTAAVTSEHIFYVTADYVNISGFTVTGATGSKAGIYLDNVAHCNISDNNASDNNYGIYLSFSNNNNLIDNIANLNNDHGICLDQSSNNTLMSNTANSNKCYGICCIGAPPYYSSNHNTLTSNNASNNNYGIWLDFSSNNNLTNNTMSRNTYNFGVYGDTLSQHVQNIDESNSVNGKPVYYWINQQNKQVPDNAGFVGIISSINITARDLILTNNSMGILFVCTNNSRIENVTANLNDRYGIYLFYSSNNNLTNNTVSYNNNHGICLDESSNNTLTYNTVNSNNEYDIDGIHLMHSDYNTLENNTASNSYCGIHLDCSDNNKLAGNNASGNDGGISMRYGSNDNTLTDNIANSNEWYGIAIDSSSNNNLANNTANTNDHYGISMYKSSSNTITGNNISDNNLAGDTGSGISMYDSDNNNLKKNTVNLNDYGIRMEYSYNNIISCNWVYENSKRGFYLSSGGMWNNISYNNIMSNGRLQSDGSYHWNFYNGQCTVEARNNYWGTTNLTIIDAGICDDDEGWHIVKFYPPADGPVPCAPGPEIHGDVNHDGKLSTADAVLALQMAVGSIDTDSAADVDSDGKITSLDALMIIQAVAGNIEIG